MILSFSITCKLANERGVPDPLRTGTKTVSRRIWTDQNAQRWINAYRQGKLVHQAWSASPYVKGAYRIGNFRLNCEPYQEVLKDMPESDVAREGGFWATRQDFIDDIGKGNPFLIVWVIRWDNFILPSG